MKQIIKALTATAIVAVLVINNANAQKFLGSAIAESINPLAFDSTTNPGEFSAASDLSMVNLHALKDFQKAFKGVNASWHKANDGGYVAGFKTGEVKNLVAYTAKGVLHHSIRYYDEKELPKDVRFIVKSTYYDYAILDVSEVTFKDQVVYIILIQDETTLKTLRVCDGEMQEVKKITRG